MPTNQLKVALVHDWLTGMRGGEKVLEVMCDLYPEAPIYTLLHNPGSVSATIESHPIHTSFIDRLPFKKKRYRNYLPLFPAAIELFNLKSFDLILSTSHCAAKGVLVPPHALHISYLHTPMRYVWDMYHEYFGEHQAGWFSRQFIPFFANYLRVWDVTSSERVDGFLANSRHVANRIRRYYGKQATVLYPPVETAIFNASPDHDDYYLVVSALVPYKKADLAVRAFNQLQKRLLIVGSGPVKRRLQKMAGASIQFVDWQPHARLVEYYSRCRALIFPGEEDFGIVPVEAMACGKPVIAYAKGGALETVIGTDQRPDAERTGIFFHQPEVPALIAAVQKSESITWNADFIARHARKFDKEIFKKHLQEYIHRKCLAFFQEK